MCDKGCGDEKGVANEAQRPIRARKPANIYGIPCEDVILRIDKPTLDYIEKETERCGLSPSIVANSFLRGSCKEGKRMNIENCEEDRIRNELFSGKWPRTYGRGDQSLVLASGARRSSGSLNP